MTKLVKPKAKLKRPPEPKAKRPATRIEEVDPEARAIGARIVAAMLKQNLTAANLADFSGLSVPAVKKIKSGESCRQWAKLGRLARALGTTPNALLAFNETSSLYAILTTVFQKLNLSLAEAEGLAEIVLQVAAEPPVESATMTPDDAARAQAAFAVRQFLAR